jgi:hypothetical protein
VIFFLPAANAEKSCKYAVRLFLCLSRAGNLREAGCACLLAMIDMDRLSRHTALGTEDDAPVKKRQTARIQGADI